MRKNIERYNRPRGEIEAVIDQWRFNERDRALLNRRLLDGILFDPHAEEFGLSVYQTKSIVYKGTERIIKHL